MVEIHEIHVLLVHPDKEFINYTSAQLKSCSYKVTAVENASQALHVLSSRRDEIDIMLVNMHLLDMDPTKLLHLTAAMNLLTVMFSNYYDSTLAASMIEEGAFMFLPNPLTVDMLRYLWQHVIREKQRKNKILQNVVELENFNKFNGKRCSGEGSGSVVVNNIMGKGSPIKRAGTRKSLEMINEDSEPRNNPTKVQKKGVTEWTEELRAKFWDAVSQLGEGKCYPKNILEAMNVPGLSRHNVSSYLQHCRNANDSEGPTKLNPPRGDGPRTRINKRSFGSMPLPAVEKFSNYAPPNCRENNRSPKNSSPPGKNIMINEKGKNVEQSSIPHMPTMPQAGSYGTLFSANENEISNANVPGENIATNGAVSMTNFPSYTRLLSDFGNATSYLGDNFFDVTNDGCNNSKFY